MLTFHYRPTHELKIVTWTYGRNKEIEEMIHAADNGDIDLTDYWAVGDARSILINAIEANTNGAFSTAMSSQYATMVLMNIGYNNQESIYFVVGQRRCLNQKGRMHSTTSTTYWRNCNMKYDLNNLYYNALPDYFKILLKDFNVPDDTGSQKVALFSNDEIGGTLEYYATTSNRKKVVDSTYGNYWTRSKYLGNNNYTYYYRDKNGSSQYGICASKYGIAPFVCI